MNIFTKALRKLAPTSSARSPVSDQAAAWLEAEQARYFERLIPLAARLLLFASLPTVLILVSNLTFQAVMILLCYSSLLGGFQAATYFYRRRQQPRTGIVVLLLVLSGVILAAAMTFISLLLVSSFLALLIVLIASAMLSARAGRLAALGLVTGGLLLILAYHFDVIQPIYLPPALALAITVIAFAVTLFMGIFLVSLKTESALQALGQAIEESDQLEIANHRMTQNLRALKQAEQQRLALAVERERVNVLSNFIRDASHEFRTPLSVINMQLYLLRRKCTDAENEQRLGNIQEQAEYLHTLLEALLEMARLDKGFDLTLNPVKLNSLVEIVVSTLQSQIERGGVRIELALSADQPTVLAAQEPLSKALYNLVQNAVEHTPPGGTITIQVGLDKEHSHISVIDNGEGISPEDLPHIFDRFYRADSARTTRGVGLGLPIARKIVEAHLGYIECSSTLGQGSTFTILLPVSQPAAQHGTGPLA